MTQKRISQLTALRAEYRQLNADYASHVLLEPRNGAGKTHPWAIKYNAMVKRMQQIERMTLRVALK